MCPLLRSPYDQGPVSDARRDESCEVDRARPRRLDSEGHLVLRPLDIPARATACPGREHLAQVVVLDGRVVPAPQHYRAWADDLAAHGFTAMRTGALSVRQAHQAELAGLVCVQELVLLEMGPSPRPASRLRPATSRPARLRRTRRLRIGQLDDIAAVDRAAFGEQWCLSAAMLADVRTATPTHRARIVTGQTTAPVDGFIIAGRAARTGYVQRLAVHPDAQRRGVGQALLGDAVSWMRRARVHRVYVNTHVDNGAALALYRENGFRELPERLRVYEGPTST